MGKVSLISLGCPKNLVDSDNLLKGLGGKGIIHTPDPEDADIILVNTCGFIEAAKRESIDEILKLRHFGKEGKKILVFGCLAERYREQLMREIPEIDALWGIGAEEQIIGYCTSLLGKGSASSLGRRPGKARQEETLRPFSHAYLKIAEGCNRGCTFCVIPSIRGPFRSIEQQEILRRAREYISAGVKELIIIAQDIGSYGKDLRGHSLVSLLKKIVTIDGDFWVRLLYLYPTAVDEGLLRLIAGQNKICKYLDMPLQHSEDRILRLMGRGVTRQWIEEKIRQVREAVPGITLRTTFIVGFPGETKKEFEALRDFIGESRFDRLGVFTYSREEGTPAYGMSGRVSAREKERRRDEIMRLQSAISLEKNRVLLGRRFRALIDERDGNTVIGRLASHAPEIDGVVFIEGKNLRKGDFVTVEITEAYDYDLKAIAVP